MEEIIKIESQALYKLIKEVVTRIKAEQHITENRWISRDAAMKKLGIKSLTTLQRFRDEGKIRFTQERKIILYDAESIDEYLTKFSHETF
jgi:hypothetical protein